MEPIDSEVQSFLRAFHKLARAAQEQQHRSGELVSDRLREFLGVDPGSCPVVTESVAPSRWVDADVALAALADEDQAGELIGVRGGEQRLWVGIADMVTQVSGDSRYEVGPLDYVTTPAGPNEERACVSLGLDCSDSRTQRWLSSSVVMGSTVRRTQGSK